MNLISYEAGFSLTKLKDISFSYGKGRGISDVSVSLESGKATTLIGPNGAGKTTLLNLFAGVSQPHSGSIEQDSAINISYLRQTGHQTNWMPLTVNEALKMSRYKKRGLWKRLKSEDAECMDRASERMEISDLRKLQFRELSLGQRQRVRLAVALAQEPDLLLMDEPLSGLDIPSQERIQKVTLEELDRGAAVVLATHSLEEAAAADEVLLMDGGVVAQGSPKETLTEENLRRVYKDRLQLISGQRLMVLDHHDHNTH